MVTTPQTCSLAPFLSKVVPADSGTQLFIQQLEIFLRKMLEAVCADIRSAGGVTAFTSLSDVPHSYAGEATKVVRVNAAQTGLEFFALALVTAFTQLSDVPNSYTGKALQYVRVKAAENGLEFFDLAATLVTAFIQLSDVPNSYSGQALKALRVNAGANAVEFFTQVFTLLADVPSSYSGAANKVVAVNPAETGLVFTSTTITDVDALGSMTRTIMWVVPNEANGFSSFGPAVVVFGASTATTRPSTGSAITGRERAIVASVSGTHRYAGPRNGGVGIVFRGNNAGEGGFRFTAVFACASTAVLAQQKGAIGLFAAANLPTDGVTTTQPSAFTDCVFVGYDSAATTLTVYHNDNAGTCTAVGLGAGFPVNTTTMYRVRFTCPPNNSDIHYEVINVDTGAVASGDITTDRPTNTTNMFPMMISGSGTTNGVARIQICSMLVEAYAY